MEESLKQADEAVLISHALLHLQGVCQPFSCVCVAARVASASQQVK